MFDRLLRALFPPACLLCDLPLDPGAAAAPDLCAWCHAALPWNLDACRQCALPRAPGAADPCPTCEWFPPPWTRAIVPLRYDAPVAGWIRQLKDRMGLTEGRVLGLLLAEAARVAYTDAAPLDVLLPVPLTYRRLAARGHNQSIVLALAVGRRLGIPVQRTGARRVRHTPPQRGLAADARAVNLVGAFATRRDWQGRRVGVVDDVLTTGATLTELALLLLDAGAAEVHVLCPARAIRAPPALTLP